jgi:hypothetical protein
MALSLYLKYFHEGKNLDKMLEQVETENKMNEEGTTTAEHVDNLRE